MERKTIKSVSVEQNSHNCDIDVNLNLFGIVDGHFKCFYERFPDIICESLAFYLDLLESAGHPELFDKQVIAFCRNCVYRCCSDDKGGSYE